MKDSRIHALDGLRAVAMLGVVAAHSALSFMETPIGWAIRDESRWLGVDFVVWCSRAFLMPAFFLLAGLLAHALVERRGLTDFFKRRAERLLVPLAVCIVPVSAAMNAMWDWGRELAGRAPVAESVPHIEASELPVTLAHLWFLYYLLIVSVGLGAALWGLCSRRKARGTAKNTAGLPLILIPLLAVVLWWAGKLQLDTPLGFSPNLPVLVFHSVFFVWGWSLHPEPREKLAAMAKHTVWWGVVGLVSLGMALPDLLDGAAGSSAAPSWHGVLGSAGFSVSLVAFALGVLTRRCTGENRQIRLLSDAAYWCYIVHLPVVVLLQIAVSQVGWPGPVEFGLVFGGAMAVSLGSYRYLVKATALARFVG